ncbi:WD40 repeat domain-containing protein [Leucothrix sargassi]|nr:WD40 repeat domain-containing protein [Leucothrix sargassi]
MLKHILQKSVIGLSIGLMTVHIGQASAQKPLVPLSVDHLAFSNDSSQLLYLLNTNSGGKAVIKAVNAMTGEAQGTTLLSLNQRILGFTPDGFKTAVLEPKGLSILHNKTGKVLRTLKVPPLQWANQYAAKGAITNKSGTAQLFHSANKRVLSVVHTGNGRVLAQVTLTVGTLRAMGISQDGRHIAYVQDLASNQSQLHLYDTYQKKVIKRLDITKLNGDLATLHTIVFSPKGDYVLVADQLIAIASEQVTRIMRKADGAPAIFTPNGRFLLVSSGNGQLLRYDLRSKQKHGINLGLPKGCGLSSASDISPNERFIALGSRCPGVKGAKIALRVLSAADGSLVKRLSVTP